MWIFFITVQPSFFKSLTAGSDDIIINIIDRWTTDIHSQSVSLSVYQVFCRSVSRSIQSEDRLTKLQKTALNIKNTEKGTYFFLSLCVFHMSCTVYIYNTHSGQSTNTV